MLIRGKKNENMIVCIFTYAEIGWPSGAVTPSVYRCGAVFIFPTPTVSVGIFT